MKYRVMIIDDERAIRNLLKNAIKWENYDMEVAGEAESGIEAINTIDEIRPHLVFVDIRMPFMDGIEFSRLVKERYSKLKIIVLTAFNEFEYAKECIGIGVSEYILKPINREEVNGALRKVKTILDEEVDEQVEEPVIDSPIGNRIIQYIDQHFTEDDLNLTKTAMEFGYNSSYLSRRIKQEMGKTFTALLIEKRMEAAKQYAEKGMVMYLAAKKTGIPDPAYFGKCFKKYTGCSYSDFALRKENADGETGSVES